MLMNVLEAMPQVDMDVEIKVEDDDNENKITAGSVVTISVNLTRKPLKQIMELALGEEVYIKGFF